MILIGYILQILMSKDFHLVICVNRVLQRLYIFLVKLASPWLLHYFKHLTTNLFKNPLMSGWWNRKAFPDFGLEKFIFYKKKKKYSNNSLYKHYIQIISTAQLFHSDTYQWLKKPSICQLSIMLSIAVTKPVLQKPSCSSLQSSCTNNHIYS